MCVQYVCFVRMIHVCALWLISLLVNPSSAGRRLEFVVAVVVLLGDLRRGTDHQNTPLQRSRASAGWQRLRGKWERDSSLPCRPMSKWVELTQTQQQHLRYSCVTDKHPNFLMSPQGCIFCVLGRPSASLSGNVLLHLIRFHIPVWVFEIFHFRCLELGSSVSQFNSV